MKADRDLRDHLTGAYSRTELNDRLQEEVARAKRYGTALSLLLIDLDHFKSINDAFGHTRGDQVLVEFLDRLRSVTRTADLIFRYGGDEFVLLLPHTDREEALVLAGRLLESVRGVPISGDPPISLSLSIGVAALAEAQSAEALFEKADLRLMEAKRRGRGQAIAKDPAGFARWQRGEPSRLVEREAEVRTMHRFFDSLSQNKRGTLEIHGPAGSGKSRLLSEVARSARLRGYEVLVLEATPALRARAYGAFAESSYRWNSAPITSELVHTWARELPALLDEQGRPGLLVAIDNLADLDPDSLSLLQWLHTSKDIPLFALAWTAEPKMAVGRDRFDSPLRELVELKALSEEGIRIWLREVLQWEPEDGFLRWMHQQTAGLPAAVQTGLVMLIERRWIEEVQEGWKFRRPYQGLPLATWIEEQKKDSAGNLPSLSYFVGRDDEMARAKRILGEKGLLVIVGPGGMGKTRLALQVAAELQEIHKHGAYHVPLAALGSPELMVTKIGESLDLPFLGSADQETQLLDFLQHKEMLLLLDGFEHLLEATGIVRRIRQKAPAVSVIITSRERPAVDNEVILDLGGMPFPESVDVMDVEAYGAVQLFLQGARRAHQPFSLAQEEIPAVVRICQLVEGMPLGLGLASAWVSTLSCDKIAKEIESNLDFLTTRHGEVDPRHRSLRAVFDHFWSLLSDEERTVLKKLSVFRGGFEAESAYQVAGASLFFLTALVDRAFLQRGSGGRYEMHEVLRQYSEERLLELEEGALRTHQAHCEYFARMVVSNEIGLLGGDQKNTLDRVRQEIENVRAGWSWAVENRRFLQLDRFLNGMFLFYETQGWALEGESVYRQALEAWQQGDDSTDLPSDLQNSLLGRLATRQGRFCMRLSRYDEARTTLSNALDALREAGMAAEVALALDSLGELERRLGAFQRAQELHREAIELCRQADDPHGLGRALSNLGVVTGLLGEYQEARSLFQESLEVRRKIQDQRGIAGSLNNLGNVADLLGEPRQAERLFEESLSMFRDLGDQFGLSNVLNNLGLVAQKLGDFDRARRLYEESLAIHHQIGNQLGAALTLSNLGSTTLDLEDTMASRDYFVAALETAMNVGEIPMALEALIGIASICVVTGDYAAAMDLCALVLHHSGSEQETKDKASELIETLRDKLPKADIETSLQAGLDMRLEDCVEEVLSASSAKVLV